MEKPKRRTNRAIVIHLDRTGGKGTIKAPGIPATAGILPFLQHVPIGEIFEVLVNATPPSEAITHRPVLRDGDVIIGGSDPPETGRFSVAVPPHLWSESWSATSMSMPIACRSSVALRPRSSEVPALSVCIFFRSGVGREILSHIFASASGADLIRTVSELAVPILPPEVVEQFEDHQALAEEITDFFVSRDNLEEALFHAKSRDDFEHCSLQIQTSAQQVRETLGSLGNVDYQIRNFYPFPLAFPYRLLSARQNAEQLYRQQLRVAENLMAFVCSVSLAIFDECPPDMKAQLESFWKGGVSPGDWRDVAKRCCRISLQNDRSQLHVALEKLWFQGNKRSRFDERIEGLIQIKNHYKHDRGPDTDREIADSSKKLQQLIDACLKDLACFLQFPIRLVLDVDIHKVSGGVTLRTLRYAGDHPALRREEVRYPEPLPRTLFIEVAPDSWVRLFPFLSVQDCPRCHSRETYFVDSWKDGGARLKSFEYGHTLEDVEVGDALNRWIFGPSAPSG